jgi:hypothetical protein
VWEILGLGRMFSNDRVADLSLCCSAESARRTAGSPQGQRVQQTA